MQALRDGMQRLAAMQPLNDACGAVHAAALLTTDGGFTVREDVGRHNAIDKAVGAVMRAGQVPHTPAGDLARLLRGGAQGGGSRLPTGRGDLGAHRAGAATGAARPGVTLVGWTRPPRLTVYCGELS